jgi:hypothetical protein
MKRNFLMMALVCLFTVVAISSCKKDDDDDGSIGNTLTVTVENGSSLNEKIDAVKVEIEYGKLSSYDWDTYEATNAPYSNGGFTLTLPETVSDTYLEAFDAGDFEEGITVSNFNVKTGYAYIEAYKADDNTGFFYHGTGTADEDWEGELVYSNGDVSITGSYTDTYDWEDSDGVHTETYTEKYNVHLKKGWNRVYEKDTEKGNNTYEEETTTTVPSGAKWYYFDYSSKSLSSRVSKVSIFSSKRK